MLFGYENVDGKATVNNREAEIVRYIYDKYHEYTNNPPDVLIQEVIAEAEDVEEILDAAEIKARASLKIIPYLAKEVNEKWPNFKERISNICFMTRANTNSSKSESVVSIDLWDQVQEKLKKQKGKP